MKYMVVIEKGEKAYGAHVPDLPGCIAAAETEAKVKQLNSKKLLSSISKGFEKRENRSPSHHHQACILMWKLPNMALAGGPSASRSAAEGR